MDTISLRDVSKFYGRATAVDDVSLQIPRGEFLTLLGPSGCGKTTTLRLIAGLVLPDRGTIMLGGSDVTNVPVHRRNIGMAFQSHALFPHMTVGENVAFGLKMRGVGRAERDKNVQEALGLVRLAEYGGRMPSQLSGGQQQRIALARALVFRPLVLLLDEPFGALDRKLRELMQVELRELTTKIGMTSIFVTHDQEEALILSDRVAVMSRGRVEQIDKPSEIFERPATRFVADFMGFGNIFEGRVIRSGAAGAKISVGGLLLDVDDGDRLVPDQAVAVAVRAERISVTDAQSAGTDAHIGVVQLATYQGVSTAYRIQLDGLAGQELIVREPTQGGGRPQFQAGQRVAVSWPSDAVRFLAS